jgi:hypothetical protein
MVTAELAGVAGHALGALHRLSLPTDRSVTAPSAMLNWTATRMAIALSGEDGRRRHLADREVPLLLARPPPRDRFQRIIDALA